MIKEKAGEREDLGEREATFKSLKALKTFTPVAAALHAARNQLAIGLRVFSAHAHHTRRTQCGGYSLLALTTYISKIPQMVNQTTYPNTPPRLDFVFQSDPLYFVTFCTYKRRKILASNVVQEALCDFGKKGLRQKNTALGRYVIMPDHVHLFVRGPRDFALTRWMASLRRTLGRALKEGGTAGPYWQRGFFDHLLRHDESYTEKWEYVRLNPERAGLVEKADDWPYQGQIAPIRF
jgi:REP element-mobilizing transposase RayT